LDDPNFSKPDPFALPDDILFAPEPHLFHRIFFGDEGLRAGWGILLFVLLCIGSNYTVSSLHLLPSQPHATTAQSSPELPPVSSIVSESVILMLVSLATLILSRIERRPIGVYGLGGSGRLRLFLYRLFWGLVLLSVLVLVLWQARLLVFDRLLLAPAVIFRYAAVWAFGFLIVALFEETFLRGYPVAFPYAFFAGIATGYVRRATGSTFNTVLIHVINNVVLLTLGLHLFGH
jgi:membrane protease YdiL (CAAX protease family)